MNRLVENFNAIAPNASSYVETNIKLNEVYNKIQNKQSDFDSYNTSMDRIKSHMAGPNVIDSMEEYRNLAGAEGEWRGYHDMGWNAPNKEGKQDYPDFMSYLAGEKAKMKSMILGIGGAIDEDGNIQAPSFLKPQDRELLQSANEYQQRLKMITQHLWGDGIITEDEVFALESGDYAFFNERKTANIKNAEYLIKQGFSLTNSIDTSIAKLDEGDTKLDAFIADAIGVALDNNGEITEKPQDVKTKLLGYRSLIEDEGGNAYEIYKYWSGDDFGKGKKLDPGEADIVDDVDDVDDVDADVTDIVTDLQGEELAAFEALSPEEQTAYIAERKTEISKKPLGTDEPISTADYNEKKIYQDDAYEPTLPKIDSNQEISSINKVIGKSLNKNKESLVEFNTKNMNDTSLQVDKLERLWKPINAEYKRDMADLKRLKAEYQDWVDTGGAGWFVWDEPEADAIQKEIARIGKKWHGPATRSNPDIAKILKLISKEKKPRGDISISKVLKTSLAKITKLKENYNKARTRLNNLKKIK